MEILNKSLENEQQIAYIYLCHNNPELLGRVANVLKYKKDIIFVHVDRKVDIKPFVEACAECQNVYFVPNRIDNYWGGFNSVIATIETIKSALNLDKYTRFVLLQGQDYPLFSPKEIHRFFERNINIEYCKAKNITISPQKRDYIKWSGYWLMDIPNGVFFKIIRAIVARFNCLGIKYRSGIFKYQKEKWNVYHGWAQFCLTRECIEHIINIYENCPRYNKFMKHRFPPDELYFHTIIYNSKFKKNVSQDVIIRRDGEKTLLNCTYFEYPQYVTVFNEKTDYEWLKKTGCLFVRKVNTEMSKDLLDEIDRNIKTNLE